MGQPSACDPPTAEQAWNETGFALGDAEALCALLRGTAGSPDDGVDGTSGGGVEAFAAAQSCCRAAYAFLPLGALMPFAALLCERKLRDDAWAEQYAARFLQRGGLEADCSTALALLGRVAARRGRRDDAVVRWREAAAAAMEARWHLLALGKPHCRR